MKRYLRAFVLALLPLVASAQQSPSYKFIKKINLPGDGKWDYMKMDGEMEKLYVSHGDRVHVIDLNTDSPVAEWTSLANVHGISLGKTEKKVYIANTGMHNVVIYSSESMKKIATVELPGGKKPDCILFDKYSQKAFVFCGESHNVFVIDGKSDAVVGTIDVGGKPEFACTDDKGFIYNNIEDTNEVIVIDVTALKVVKRFSLSPDKAPTGITIDTKNGRLMTTCEESKNVVVLDQQTGKRIATVPIGGKTDGIIFDKDLGILVTSNGEGSATIIKQETSDKYAVLQTLKTQRGLKTIVHRGTTHKVYISGADLQADGKTPVPSTFGVFVYAPETAN